MSLCSSCQDPATVRLFLITLIGLWNIVAKADDCSCQRYGGCNPCPSSGTCTRINVALNKSASASRLISSPVYKEVSGPPCLAVNGDTGTTYRPINWYPDNPACVMTDPSDYFPYWEVNLGQQYIISTITVYGREGSSDTLRKAEVTVDDRLCYTFAPDYSRPTIAQITCSSPLTGKKVRIQKVNVTNIPYFLVCQIQVWGCTSGFYGINCTNTCGNCSGGACDPSSGECPQGCSAGYVGQYCKEKCRPGTFGAGCYNTCGSCAQNSLCNIYDGRCETGCSAGFKPPLCNTCLQCDDHQSTNTAVPIAGAVVGSICGCVLGFLLGVLFMRYRHRQWLDERSSVTDFPAPIQTVHNQEAAGVSSFEPESSSDYETPVCLPTFTTY